MAPPSVSFRSVSLRLSPSHFRWTISSQDQVGAKKFWPTQRWTSGKICQTELDRMAQLEVPPSQVRWGLQRVQESTESGASGHPSIPTANEDS